MQTASQASESAQGERVAGEPQPEIGAGLTPREIKVLALVTRGDSNKKIARELGIAEGTVKTHLTAIFRKLNVHTRTQASRAGARMQEVSDEQLTLALAGRISIAKLLPQESSRSLAADTVIFRKGDVADALYYIVKGTVRLEELNIERGPEEMIGEMGVFSPNRRRGATARCKTGCVLLKVPAKDAMRICLMDSAFAIYVTQLVMRRLEETKGV
jgi:two-component system, NarL family, nitrate/nitrite response regulator NarL